jgi:predicted nucleic-acid-binding protein
MRAIDTNVLVRLITGDDPDQTARAEEFVQKGAWVSHLALVEATWVLSTVYEKKAAEISTAIEMLLNHENLAIQDSETVSAALDRFRRKPSICFSDYLLLEVARKAGYLPLGTFDRDLAKAEGTERI